MMSRASQIILLCEDQLQEVVIRRFLKNKGATHRSIRTIPYYRGVGSGEQFVREEYPNQIKAFRQRHAQTLLIVVIDADTHSVTERNRQLDDACEERGERPRTANEAVVYFVPKRHIETWLAYLDGQDVNETDSYKTGYAFSGRERKAKPLVDRLCRSNSSLPDKPDSLEVACNEWNVRAEAVLG
jgi:hypothetical protein